jgi:hypothetical protein
MDRETAISSLKDLELIPLLEGQVAQAKELERQLLDSDIPVLMAAKPKGACCAGGCGCGGKVQLLVREEDVPRVQQLMAQEWLDAVKREGLGGELRLVPLGVGEGSAPLEGAEAPALACPACGCAAALVEGACSDCGLQLE